MINKKLAKLMVEKPIKADVTQTENKLYLYGTIGDYWDGVTLDDVKYTSKNMDKSQVTVHINSYGGDAVEGVAIRNFLKETFNSIDVVIDGIAASSASIIATCGQTLTMPTGTTYMIHNPWAFVVGDKKDLLKEVGALESLEQSYRNVYMERFNGTEDELIQLMDDESWLTAERAAELGFADKVEVSSAEEGKQEPENTLVATLLSKYAAEAEPDEKTKDDELADGHIEDDQFTLNEDEKNEKQKEESKPNDFLSNFAKVFSTYA